MVGLKSLLRVGLDALKEWTGRGRLSVVWDSSVDWASVCGMSTKVNGKRNDAVIGFTTGGRCIWRVQQRRHDKGGHRQRPDRLFLFLQVARHAVPRPAAICRESKRNEGFADTLLNKTAFGCAIGLGCGPITVFELSIQRFVCSAFATRCQRPSKVFKKRHSLEKSGVLRTSWACACSRVLWLLRLSEPMQLN